MNDSTPQFSKMARQLAEALHLPHFDDLSDSELEDLLDRTDPDPVSDSKHEAILTHAKQLIQEWETVSMTTSTSTAKTDPQNSRSLQAVASTPVSHRDSRPSVPRAKRNGSGSAVVLAGIALLAVAALFYQSGGDKDSTANHKPSPNRAVEDFDFSLLGLKPSPKPSPRQTERVAVGSLIETKARERRRVALPDGSVLYVNENTRARVDAERKLVVEAGEVFVEVVPAHLIESKTPFVVETPDRNVTALGTKFLVKAKNSKTDVLVTQGKVKVSGEPEPLSAGQLLKEDKRQPAPRASEALLWTKELVAAATSPLVPESEHAGGALVAIDPSGQEMQLSLRKQHVDVHIEDGFARTTIDQTYFNASWSRMEGTFYFPLPADASLSRLAMYVGENLMEGGMAERNHARNVFEQIRYTRRDPALLEWVDGSTFKMRVFPLEARQEKRIVISYTQRLDSAYGQTQYRFPAGHSLELIGDWSTHILVKNHGQRKWSSPSHDLNGKVADGDLVLENAAGAVVDDRDLVIELEDHVAANPKGDSARFSRFVHEGQQYLMLRFRPDLEGDLKRKPRNWVFLFESAGNRDALLARVQIEVLQTLLKNAEHTDTFSIITAGTRSKAWKNQPTPATPENIDLAIEHLNKVHLLGAFDLEKALATCKPFMKAKGDSDAENTLVHLGAGVAVLGEKDTKALLRKLPEHATYIGVGVGKRWSQVFMKAAADKTGGHVTQINPDEDVRWRAFELLSLLNSPRVLDVKVLDELEKHPFLQFSESLAQGEELCAVTRLGENDALPTELTVTGQLAGKPYEKTIPVKAIAEDAGYLARTWAKLEIDRLVADGVEQHKDEIIKLSKAMYVMSPFTSLLVLENDAMYTQFNVDRGRKDHWALYPCPLKIEVVYEPGNRPVNRQVTTAKRAKTVEELFTTVLVRTPAMTVRWSNGIQTVAQGLNAMQIYTGAIAGPVQDPAQFRYWGFATLSDQLDFTLPTDTNSRLGVTVFPSGDLVMPVWSNRIWFDANMDGVSNQTHLLGAMPMSGPAITVWDGPATYSLPGLVAGGGGFGGGGFGGGFGPGGFGGGGLGSGFANYRAVTYPSNMNGIAFSPDGRQVVAAQPFYPSQQVPLGWRNARMYWDDGNWNLDFSRDSRRLLSRYDMAYRMQTPVRLNISSAGNATINHWLDVSDLVVPADGFILPPYWEFTQSTVEFELPDFEMPVNGTLIGSGDSTKYTAVRGIFPLRQQFEHLVSSVGETNWTIGRFGDLTSLAPGMNTTRLDLLSLLETQGPAKDLPKQGKIDPKAEALIERARGNGWETVTLPHGEGQPAFTLRCDSQGRYLYERTLTEGLKEQVVCDGERLLHLYSQLGLGSRREVSRFHRAQLRRLVPWLVPPTEDLAVGCDVRYVNENAIAVVPIQKDEAGTNEKQTKVYLLMVFSKEGRLQERRLMNAETNKPIVRVQYDADGKVSLFGKDDKRLAAVKWKRAAAKPANLKPSLKELVVLSLPFRGPESFLSANEQQQANSSQFGSFDDEKSLALLGAYHATGNVNLMYNLLNQRYFGKDDHRLGLYVLQAAILQQTGFGSRAPLLTQKHSKSALASYLASHYEWVNTGNTNQFVISNRPGEQEASADGFIERLSIARGVFAKWQTGQAVNGRSAEEIAKERQASFRDLKKLQSPELAWMLLNLMQSKDTDSRGLPDYIKTAEGFAKEAGLNLSARYQAAIWRSEHGETERAIAELDKIAEELIKAGMLPPISNEVRESYINHNGLKAWTKHLEDLQNQFLKEDRRYAAIWLAVRAGQVKTDSLSDRLFEKALKGLDPKTQPWAAQLAVGQLVQKKEYAAADELIAPFLKAEGWSEQVSIWRKAAEIASLDGKEALSVARQERALQLEYEALPDLINLQSIRNSYGSLLTRIESLAKANDAETDLKDRAIRLADRWRVLDPDDTAACQAAARIVSSLGDDDLAWDYLTTPLADKPNESAPWIALAQVMVNQDKIDWADKAYRQAFNAEATNAQILWDHAELMRQKSREEDAQELYEKLVNEAWQPRFNNLKSQAKSRLDAMKQKPGPGDEK